MPPLTTSIQENLLESIQDSPLTQDESSTMRVKKIIRPPRNQRPLLLPLVYDETLAESRLLAGMSGAGRRPGFRACLSATTDNNDALQSAQDLSRRSKSSAVHRALRQQVMTAHRASRRQFVRMPWREEVNHAVLAPVTDN